MIVLILTIGSSGCTGWSYKVVTPNMAPTLEVGDVCIIDKFAYRSNLIQRFDIVVLNAPEEVKRLSGGGDVKIIKRVVGLPGETLEIKENVIYINGKLLAEPFEKLVSDSDKGRNYPLIRVPEGEYFFLGDNRPESLDSRFWTHSTVKGSEILGKVERVIPGR